MSSEGKERPGEIGIVAILAKWCYIILSIAKIQVKRPVMSFPEDDKPGKRLQLFSEMFRHVEHMVDEEPDFDPNYWQKSIKRWSSLEGVESFTLSKGCQALSAIAAPDLQLRESHNRVAVAFCELEKSLKEAEDTEIRSAIDHLIHYPSLSEDRLVLAKRMADRKRELLARIEFLDAKSFAELIPGAITGKNPSRTLGRWVADHKALGVKIGSDWRFPLLQIDVRRGEIYKEIQALLKSATNQGYTEWEILYWLTHVVRNPLDETPGAASDKVTSETTADELIDIVEEESVSEIVSGSNVIPIELLHNRKSSEFIQCAERWLGVSA